MKLEEREESIKNNICPNCKSKKINHMPGYKETMNKKTYYCMNCEKEFDYKGKQFAPIYI